MVRPVSPGVISALCALALSLLQRRRARLGGLGFESVCLVLSLYTGLVALVATLLAWAGLFSGQALALACLALALACWPWTVRREPSPAEVPQALAQTLLLFALVGLGVGLRTPTISAPLAGRDQGTYVLRAESTLRTGSLGWTDGVLARAGRDRRANPEAPGPQDMLGLYPRNRDPWREGSYEAGYRPGAYLADRDLGRVTPQFFHLHPMCLAVAGAAFGAANMGLALLWLGALGLSILACVARRLWPKGSWAALPVALVALSPLAIWTGRTPLSEGAMAVFEWAAVLAALRLRDGVEPQRGPWWAASMLAFAALVRGNALVVLPVVLAVLWLRARVVGGSGAVRGPTWRARWSAGERAPLLLVAGLFVSVLLHADTAYPYLHDELLRRRSSLHLGAGALVGLAALGAGVWLGVDAVLARVRRRRARARQRQQLRLRLRIGSVGAVAALLAAVLLWAWLRAQAEPGPPFSRLDAAPVLLGVPLMVSAGVGALVLGWRWRPSSAECWLLALATVVPVTALLYAPRELPHLTFFYYGRYLVPELLPGAALLATGALAALSAALQGEPRRRRVLALLLPLGLGLGLIAATALPLIRHPQLRLREYEPAAEAVHWLAQRIEPGAVVIAGGEGWHHDHTHNQVGGALAMGVGVEVVPYRSREDAWISAWELLVDRPARTGEPAPPVYLLVNEAAHPGRRGGRQLALLDDQLWAPFAVQHEALIELFLHALTPVEDRLPTRVARHELRMALIELRVDPARMAEVQRLRLNPDGRVPASLAHLLEIEGGLHDDGRACLSPDRALKVTLTLGSATVRAARHLVIVGAGLESARLGRSVPLWGIRIDGRRLFPEPPEGLALRERATVGPLPLPPLPPEGEPGQTEGARVLTLWAPNPSDGQTGDVGDVGDCGYGRLLELRLLPREYSSTLPAGEVEAVSMAPRATLGHPPQPAVWVRGRSLSRYRPGTQPDPEIRARSLVVDAGRPLRFETIDLPLDAQGRPEAVDLAPTLTQIDVHPGARLRVSVAGFGEAGGTTVAEFELPTQEHQDGVWAPEPKLWAPSVDRAVLRVELVGATPGDSVALRDLALFTRGEGIPSVLTLRD